jgi:hypothetical protein
MIDIFKEAKLNKKVLHLKNFQKPEITWDEAVKFVYQQSEIKNNRLLEKQNTGGNVIGNILVFPGYYFLQENNLFEIFKGVSEFMAKVNGGKSGQECSYYKNLLCNCDVVWHVQALRFCILTHKVPSHQDPNDVLYWQLLGTSYWKINGKDIYKLEPGDLFYFNKDDFHEVYQDGPRAGIIIDAIKQRYEE